MLRIKWRPRRHRLETTRPNISEACRLAPRPEASLSALGQNGGTGRAVALGHSPDQQAGGLLLDSLRPVGFPGPLGAARRRGNGQPLFIRRDDARVQVRVARHGRGIGQAPGDIPSSPRTAPAWPPVAIRPGPLRPVVGETLTAALACDPRRAENAATQPHPSLLQVRSASQRYPPSERFTLCANARRPATAFWRVVSGRISRP